MKRIFIALAIAIAIPSLTPGQAASQTKSCEQTAKELELRVSTISQNFDKAGFEQLVADDAVLIDSVGEAKSKRQELAASFNPSPDLTFESYTMKDVKIRVCGETSIVITGTDILKAKEKGQKESLAQSYWFTRIYERRRGQWQLVYQQISSREE
jgi:ketosteroid isomerase-like protein